MKILLITNANFFAVTGATSNRWRTLIEGLDKYNVHTHLVITKGYSNIKEYKEFGIRGHITQNITYEYTSFMLNQNIWLRRINTYLINKLNNTINAFLIKRKLISFSPNIVLLFPHLEVFRIYNKIYPKGQNRHKLMIELNEYDYSGKLNATNSMQTRINMKYSFYLAEKIFPQIDFCIVMTKKLLLHYSNFPKLNPSATFLHLPMTVDLKRFITKKTISSLKQPYIGYCGSSSFSKDGVDILIKSFAKLSKKFLDFNLYIVAFWELDGEKMIKLIKDLNMGNRIFYLGEKHRDDIPNFLLNASILTLPRPNSLQAQGGFPTKLGEYLASGRPVCVTKVGEIPDYLIDNDSAFMAEPGSIISFHDALVRAITDPINAEKIGLRGKKIAETNFNMDAQANQLYNFIVN